MPIQVTCPGCKAQFNVSEKFAGKKGPCPKCKAVITIPAPKTIAAATSSGGRPTPGAPPAPKAADVKIHAPEEALKSEKSKTGRPTLKPIFHDDLRLTWKMGLSVAGAIVVLFAAAWIGGRFVRAPAPLSPIQQADAALVAQRQMELVPIYALRTIGLLLIGWPIVLAGYVVLRDDELDPYRGRSLQWRALICLVVYVGVWGLYALIPNDLKAQGYLWIFLAPALILPAAVAAYFAFDLDYLGSVIHAAFFLLVTLVLGWTAGLTMPWSSLDEVRLAPLAPDVKMEVEIRR